MSPRNPLETTDTPIVRQHGVTLRKALQTLETGTAVVRHLSVVRNTFSLDIERKTEALSPLMSQPKQMRWFVW